MPAWAKGAKIARSTYNARSETVGEKPSFRDAWKRGQLCIIPADAIFEPCYEMGKAIRWRIERADGRPMSMLTINADAHPLMQRFHKTEDEKRSVVILPDDAWGDWLRARSEEAARGLLKLIEADLLRVRPDPRQIARATDSLF